MVQEGARACGRARAAEDQLIHSPEIAHAGVVLVGNFSDAEVLAETESSFGPGARGVPAHPSAPPPPRGRLAMGKKGVKKKGGAKKSGAEPDPSPGLRFLTARSRWASARWTSAT